MICSDDKLLQEPLALPQCALAVVQRLLVGPVLGLDADWAVVTRVGQGTEEPAPVHVAQARQLWGVPPQAQDATIVEHVGIDPRVLGMDMDDAFAEVADAPSIIYVL